MARVPVQAVSSDDKTALQNLDAELKAVIFGQDAAIDEVASAIKLSRSGLRAADKPIGNFLFAGPDRRRQDRARAAAGARAEGRVPALRHVGVHGEARGVAPDRRAAGLRRLRGGRPADRRHPQVAARGAAARRDREGASGSVRDPAAGDGPRDADRHARPQGRLPPRHPDHDDQRRRARPVGPQDGLRRAGRRRAKPPACSSACSRRSSATGSMRPCTSTRSAPREIERVVDKHVDELRAGGQAPADHRADAGGAGLAGARRASTARSARGRWRGWSSARSRSRCPSCCCSATSRTARGSWWMSRARPSVYAWPRPNLPPADRPYAPKGRQSSDSRPLQHQIDQQIDHQIDPISTITRSRDLSPHHHIKRSPDPPYLTVTFTSTEVQQHWNPPPPSPDRSVPWARSMYSPGIEKVAVVDALPSASAIHLRPVLRELDLGAGRQTVQDPSDVERLGAPAAGTAGSSTPSSLAQTVSSVATLTGSGLLEADPDRRPGEGLAGRIELEHRRRVAHAGLAVGLDDVVDVEAHRDGGGLAVGDERPGHLVLLAEGLRQDDAERAPTATRLEMRRLTVIRTTRLDPVVRADGNVEHLFRVAVPEADEQGLLLVRGVEPAFVGGGRRPVRVP